MLQKLSPPDETSLSDIKREKIAGTGVDASSTPENANPVEDIQTEVTRKAREIWEES